MLLSEFYIGYIGFEKVKSRILIIIPWKFIYSLYISVNSKTKSYLISYLYSIKLFYGKLFFNALDIFNIYSFICLAFESSIKNTCPVSTPVSLLCFLLYNNNFILM